MRNPLILLCTALMLFSCTTKQDKTKFTVSGNIKNNKAKFIYLEKVPASTMQPELDDSVKIEKNGDFLLHGKKGESVVYNLRLDDQQYPIASIINDADLIKVDVTMDAANNEFAEKYDVSGSPASKQMKDYMLTVNNDLQKIFVIAKQGDTLQKQGASDSLLMELAAQHKQLTDKVKDYTFTSLDNSTDPALILFELGYYQATANASGLGVEGITSDKVKEIISKASAKWPNHSSLAAIKNGLQSRDLQEAQADQGSGTSQWIGQEAPDFMLPDASGKLISLKSFRGKYVLVDFWASWCTPCRQENPNVLSAYNQFKGNNFTVLGVSLDKPGEKDKWLEAVAHDKLPWTQVSDLMFWNSPVVALYGIQGIPFNVLIDPSGKVIGAELRGPQLMSVLAGVLK